nr:MAG: hypothetical protein [Bacteriophage sp.]
MQFLDATGLAYFWERIKNWVNINYLSLTGGTIRGSVSFLREGDGGSSITISPLNITKGGCGDNYLFASGKMIPIGEANGVAGLDDNGRIPLAQLGNLDTSLFKLVTSLPSSGESNKIYIVKDGSDANDVYQEYYYTNGAWEKIGTHAVKVDLTPYAKKTEAVINMNFGGVASDGSSTSNTTIRNLVYTLGDGRVKVADVPLAEPRGTGERPYPGQNGFMRASDKAKLDGIADGANNYTLPTASASVLGGILIGYGTSGRNYAVLLDGSGKAYVNVPWTDTNTTYDLSPYAKKMETVDFSSIRLDKRVIANTPQGRIQKQIILFNTLGDNVKSVEIVLEEAASNMSGLMSIRDKNKLDYIADGATADSAIPISVIDALN